MYTFSAPLQIIGINPYVSVPDDILIALFAAAAKSTSPLPIKGTINGAGFQQTLVRYRGEWRLYVNTSMLKNSPKRIGEAVHLTVDFDPGDRSITPHPKLLRALDENRQAKTIFDGLTPSLQREIVRYISFLKSEESVDRNVAKAIDFLLGNGPFIGRKSPRCG